MSPSSPSTTSVLAQVDSLGPPGTPVTIREIAAAFDCAVERLDTRLERLVSHRILKVKQVSDHRRVWWRPAGREPVDSSDVTEPPSAGNRRRRRAESDNRPPAAGREPDRLHSLVFDQTVQFTGVLDPDGTLIDANESALRFGGLTRAEVIGRPVWETDWWRISTRTQHRLQDAVRRAATGETVRYEVTVQGATGTMPIDFSLRPVTEGGEVTLLIAEGRNITELKEHELQLQQQRDELESELSAVLDRISDGFYSLDTRFRFQYINDHAQALLGVDESARGADIRETIETTERFRAALETAAESQEPVFFEDYYEPLGEWFDNAIYPSETGLSIYFRDITERKRLERELRTETEQFQTALDNSPVVALRQDADLRYTWVGNPIERYSPDDILGKRDDELLTAEDAAVVQELKRTVLETGEGVREEVTLHLPRGEVVYDLAVKPITDDAGEITGLAATAVDLTEQIRTREALRRSEERLRLALQAADVGTWELDLRTEESPVRSIEHDRIFGYEAGVDDWSFEVFLDHVHPDDRAAVQAGFEAAFETGQWDFECRIRRVDGVERWIAAEGKFHMDDGEPVYAVGVVMDITDRITQQEQQLATLAGAHEIVQDVAHLVIESPTQADIEAVVCDCFDAAETYTDAWVGRLDHTGPTIRPSAAGVGNSGDSGHSGDSGDSGDSEETIDCEECPIPIESDAPTIAGPIAAAIETGEPQLVHTSPTDPIYRQWSQSTPIRHRPGIVVPIRYETHVYGVVVVYTDRDGFEPRERDTLGRLGRIVGHAINAIERKRALIGDRVTEVVVRSDALAEPFLAGADDESMTIDIDRVVTLGERSLIYYTVEGIAPERFSAIIERLTGGTGRLLDGDGSRSRLELSTGTETIHSVVASHGGRITEAALRDGSFEITIRIPLGTEVRPVLDAARTIYSDLTLVSRTTITPSRPTLADAFATLAEGLTERQREALEVGYYAGFFEWPRETTGDELADLMGVTPATVHHHLRHGQQKLLDAFFDAASG